MVTELILTPFRDGLRLGIEVQGERHLLDSALFERAVLDWNAWRAHHGDGLDIVAEALSQAILVPPISSSIQAHARSARRSATRLRLVIQGGALPFAEVPWEVLSIRRTSPLDPLQGNLAMQPGLELHRRVGQHRGALPISDRLRVLVAVADPGSPRFGRLAHLDSEVRALSSALIRSDGRVDLKSLLDATPASLERSLREFRPDILHFAGHGEARVTGGALILQGAVAGTEVAVPATRLLEWVRAANCEAVVLSACNTAGHRSAVAETLAQGGISTVLAPQVELRDAWAPQFARVFYGALREGATVVEAATESRQALSGTTYGWGSVVLFSDSPDHSPFGTSGQRAIGVPSNFLTPRFPLIGRASEVQEAKRYLLRNRLVSLVGPGGIGKSRVAQQVAEEARSDFPDGVWRVDCGGCATRDDLYAAIVEALSLSTEGASVAVAVQNAFRGRRVLLVLDSVEGMVTGHDLASTLAELSGFGEVSTIATGRTRIGAPGERAISIGPLEDRAKDLFLSAAELDAATLRAPDLVLVDDICRILEGVPLALVLAAARLRILDLHQLRTLLEESPLRTLDGTENSLSSAIRRSLSLLPERDRGLLRRLSVFSGSFRWEDAVAVIGDDRFELLDGITRLSDGALLQPTDSPGGKRFRLLETVRETVRAGVPSEDETSRLRAHANTFLALARESNDLGRAGKLQDADALLWPNLGNFRAALLFAASNQLDDLVIGFADALARTYLEAGLWSEFDKVAAAAEDAALRQKRPDLRARILGLQGALAFQRGLPDLGKEAWRNRAAICREMGDWQNAADAEIDLASQAFLDGDPTAGLGHLDSAEAAIGADPAPEIRAAVAVLRARTFARQGNAKEAEIWGRKAEEHALQVQERDPLLYIQLNLGRVWELCGDLAKAESLFAAVLRDGHLRARKGQAGVAALDLSRLYENAGRAETALLCAIVAFRNFERSGSRHRREAEARLAALERSVVTIGHPGATVGELIEEILRRSGELATSRR